MPLLEGREEEGIFLIFQSEFHPKYLINGMWVGVSLSSLFCPLGL